METLLQYFIDYRYLVIFFGTFIEGEVVLLFAGYLVYEGYLDFRVLVLIAMLGAVTGDNLFYWLGRSQRKGTSYPWAARVLSFLGERRLFKGEEFVRRHGGKAVLLLRFLYGLRYAGAMTAGYLRMGFWRFFLFNLIGCFFWAVTIGALGYLFGQGLETLTRGVRLAQIGLLLILIGLLAIYLVNRRKKRRAQREAPC